MTADTLARQTCKDLARMAKQRGVPGWHGMRKDQLIQALMKAARKKATARRNGQATAQAVSRRRIDAPGEVVRNGDGGPQVKQSARRVAEQLRQLQAASIRFRDLATGSDEREAPVAVKKDRLTVMVRDPYWLHAHWELARPTVERARAALGQEWHTAKPVLRLYEVSELSATMPESETMVRHIEIHGGVNNWYIDVPDPPKSYRMEIGYRAASGRFYSLARSNTVQTPRPGSSDAIDRNWSDLAENVDRIFAMSAGYSSESPNVELQELLEERLRRPISAPLVGRFQAGVEGLLGRDHAFFFDLDAELLIFGATEPGARVTVHGEPVKLRPDGTFTMRFSLPNCRQVIPATASSADGLEQRTVVLAVERNTKTMEPLIREANEA
jgi:uncharacterized protein